MNLEEIEERLNFVLTTDLGKIPQRIEAAEAILREDVPVLIDEVKRLRRQIELEHDHGELFLTQIKDVRAEIEIERLKADLDGFIHGGL